MKLSDILNEDLIEVNLPYLKKEEVISILSTNLLKQNFITDKEQFLKDVFYRESIGMTGMGQGIAIPHGLSSSVIKAGVSICKLATPIAWESLDGEPVELVFLLAAPSDDKFHIKMLSQLASILAYEENINTLKKSNSKEEFLRIFEKLFEQQLEKRKKELGGE